MAIPVDPKLAVVSERFARLFSSGRAWLANLEATQADMERHLDSPMARFLLPENGVPDTVASDQDEGQRAEGALSPLQQLETCETQEQICEVIARANDSTIDLRDAIPQIRKADLAKPTTGDRGIIKNLGSRLLESGRWERVRPAVYKLKGHPVAKGSTAGVVDGQIEPPRSEGDDSGEGMRVGGSPDLCRSDESSCDDSS